jgi:hypothetical protein
VDGGVIQQRSMRTVAPNMAPCATPCSCWGQLNHHTVGMVNLSAARIKSGGSLLHDIDISTS